MRRRGGFSSVSRSARACSEGARRSLLAPRDPQQRWPVEPHTRAAKASRLTRRVAAVAAFAFLAVIAIAGAGCGIDHNVAYAPSPDPILLLATGPDAMYAFSPTVSADGRVVAWVEHLLVSGTPTQRVIRWDRVASPSFLLADTVWTSTGNPLAGIDLSADGTEIAGWMETGLYALLWDSTHGARVVGLPPAFDGLVSAAFVDSTSIVIGAEGPEGRGVYSWNVSTGATAPLITRFTSDGSLRSDAWVDASGARACMQEKNDLNQMLATVYARDGRILFQQPGSRPRFWRLVPGRPEGLMYLDPQGSLWGIDLDGGATSDLILRSVQDYDVSPDGGWLFARAIMGRDYTIFLVLADMRDTR